MIVDDYVETVSVAEWFKDIINVTVEPEKREKRSQKQTTTFLGCESTAISDGFESLKNVSFDIFKVFNSKAETNQVVFDSIL